MRTFRSQEFPGGQLVKRLEHERGDEMERSVNKVVPVRKGAVGQAPIYVKNFEDVYGFRGNDPRVYYLNPWEFLMHWDLEPLRPPSQQTKNQPGVVEFTKWIDARQSAVSLFCLCFFWVVSENMYVCSISTKQDSTHLD